MSKGASILGHESEGVVTPAGLQAWSRGVRAQARGRGGNGILGWGVSIHLVPVGQGTAQR